MKGLKKMLVLGIDTSSPVAAIALVGEHGLLAEINIELIHRHSERLIPNIDYLFKETNYSIDELTGLAVGLGPGSFTGLRIGLSTIKTFAQVRKLPVKGLSTLDIMAYGAQACEGMILPLLDARRERVYCAMYDSWNKDIKKVKIWGDSALSVTELIERLKGVADSKKIYVMGNGFVQYQEVFNNASLELIPLSFVLNYPQGGLVAELGAYYLKKGLDDGYLAIKPNYLKRPQAEINWYKKESR
ncbi:tRNA (adenosine(37)-N6)-threonylcarbamoyltransferase complex dimerization subunit type 1 TsaB [Iocasia frigidifontis]|uniref:tRNA (Adenosine(37)-N6)-threonylcarbamoyltransferase complex dimerization subunit type 1 TsaB n=1 Tax=Iocasia fonsfrigidae TaxID=2682810 RepID=A0A8A7KGL2_9FIRM|nr:tRNA (adenosine(37)-N6)-threonylcarbamoyltransferase complex dimerization subunit type 1 TsaB [Iocasia fonsfrigidae]QTL99225.1 tRNA (adenosine(37)-N6)-threonylcarbamoyltransferase complex dimerization subunit type 1 TsaB [Iocasia fonsfrigidae]